MAPTTGVPALSRRTPAQEAAGVEAKADPQKQRKTANMSALACKRGEASLLTADATDFFEGVIFISSLSVDFETEGRAELLEAGREGRHRFRSCREAPRDVYAPKCCLPGREYLCLAGNRSLSFPNGSKEESRPSCERHRNQTLQRVQRPHGSWLVAISRRQPFNDGFDVNHGRIEKLDRRAGAAQ